MAIKRKKTETTKFPVDIPVTQLYKLCDWNDALSFDDISDTISIVKAYQNDAQNFPKDIKKVIEVWLKQNDMAKFTKAYQLALMAQAEQLEQEEYVRDIMSYPSKRPMSH